MTVEELLNKKGHTFKPSGNDYLISCLNPEHDDSNPSMRIDRVLGVFNCLSCGYKGNIFFYYGEKINQLDTAREKLKRKLLDIRIQSVGLKMPEDATGLSAPYRASLDTLKSFEAFRSTKKDYAGRIVFPIRDLKGKITCFIGRSEDPYDKVRYKVVPSGAKLPLFPLQAIKPVNGVIMLVEGIFDMLNLYDNEFTNVVCALSIKAITAEKLELLKVIGVTGIDICFDPDNAGQEAASAVKELAEGLDFQVRNINLNTCDPGDLTSNRASKLKEQLYGG